jgi:hypothetical protein
MVMVIEAVLQRAAPPADMAAARHVAMSADGTRALVGYATLAGASRDDVGLGVYSFVRSGTAWSFEALVDPMAQTAALSPDGLTAVVHSSYTLTRVYNLVSGNWVLSSFSRPMANVTSIVFSGDGQTFVLARAATGGSAVYTLVAGTWTSQGVVPNFTDDVWGSDRDATRIVSGNGSTGHVYTRTAPGAWTLEYTTSRPGVSAGAISADGSRALFADAGGPVVYTRAGTTWSASYGLWGGGTGPFTVAISPDGSRAFWGFPYNTAGAVVHGVLLGATGYTDAWSCNGLYPNQGSAIAISADGGRLIAGAPGQSSAGPDDAIVCVTSDALGAPCTTSAGCGSGFCVDGVCCDSACGGGAANDCMACSSTLTGGTNGECGSLSTRIAPTVTCRPAVPGVAPGFSSCDLAESCEATSTACPPDAFFSAVVCHVASGPCELSVVCDGTSAACAPAYVAAGTTCRFASGPCDATESCSGSGAACPPDALLAAGTTCRPATGVCDPPDTCDGTTAGCDATFAPASTTCRAAVDACDVAEHCTGATPSCPDDVFAPPWTVCAPSGGGVCDAPDLCSGTSATCVPTFASGVVCRPAAGACDVAESCSGTSANCPPDATEGAGTVCRASTAPCDPAESCDGTSTTCPPDVSTCTAQPDTGVRDAGASDASSPRDGSGSDASTAPAPTASCGCRAGTRAPAMLPLIAIAALLLARRRSTA